MGYDSVERTLEQASERDDPRREADVIQRAIFQLKEMKEKLDKLDETDIEEVRERVQPHIAEPSSEEGHKIIHDDRTHVKEVWEDGELTTTKSGDLYRSRSLHQSAPPVWPEGSEVLFDVESGDHKRMVVTDREALEEILDDYR